MHLEQLVCYYCGLLTQALIPSSLLFVSLCSDQTPVASLAWGSHCLLWQQIIIRLGIKMGKKTFKSLKI